GAPLHVLRRFQVAARAWLFIEALSRRPRRRDRLVSRAWASPMTAGAIAFLSLAVWAYLLLGRGGFWLCRERDDAAAAVDNVRIRRAAFSSNRHREDPRVLARGDVAIQGVVRRPTTPGLLPPGSRRPGGRNDDRGPRQRTEPDAWPSIVAIIPARDEADTIAHCVGSLLAQDYPGPFSVVVVDDQSADGTAA